MPNVRFMKILGMYVLYYGRILNSKARKSADKSDFQRKSLLGNLGSAVSLLVHFSSILFAIATAHIMDSIIDESNILTVFQLCLWLKK